MEVGTAACRGCRRLRRLRPCCCCLLLGPAAPEAWLVGQTSTPAVDPRAGQYCYAGSTHPYLVPPFASGGAAAEEGVGAGAKHCAQVCGQPARAGALPRR